MPTIPYVATSYSTTVSAAQLNNGESGITNVSYAPCVRVTHNAAQSITTSTATKLNFNTERFDQAGNAADTMHDTVTNNTRLTCRYAGVYQITANWTFAANATGWRYGWIFLNNTDIIGRTAWNAGAAIAVDQAVTTLWSLAVNDFVEVQVFQTSGGNLNVELNAKYSPEFMMVRVG